MSQEVEDKNLPSPQHSPFLPPEGATILTSKAIISLFFMFLGITK